MCRTARYSLWSETDSRLQGRRLHPMPHLDLMRAADSEERKEIPERNSDLRARLIGGAITPEIISRDPKTSYMEDLSSIRLASLPRDTRLVWLANFSLMFVLMQFSLFLFMPLNTFGYDFKGPWPLHPPHQNHMSTPARKFL